MEVRGTRLAPIALIYASKLPELRHDGYPFLAFKSAQILEVEGSRTPHPRAAAVVFRSVTSYGTFRLTSVDASRSGAHIGQTTGVQS